MVDDSAGSKFEASKPIRPSTKPDSPFVQKDAKRPIAHGEVTCTYGGNDYAEGAEICWGGTIHQCHSGAWINIGTKCRG